MKAKTNVPISTLTKEEFDAAYDECVKKAEGDAAKLTKDEILGYLVQSGDISLTKYFELSGYQK